MRVGARITQGGSFGSCDFQTAQMPFPAMVRVDAKGHSLGKQNTKPTKNGSRK